MYEFVAVAHMLFAANEIVAVIEMTYYLMFRSSFVCHERYLPVPALLLMKLFVETLLVYTIGCEQLALTVKGGAS